MHIITAVIIENGKRVRKPLALEPRNCILCGKTFEPKRQDSLFCSRLCGKRYEYRKHSKRYIENSKVYYKNNLEKCIEKRKKYYWSNPEYFKEKTREYNKLNKELKNKKDNEYKDKIRHGNKKQELINEFGCVCHECGKISTTFDIVAHHITFDKLDHDNQILLCRSCHMKLHQRNKKK